MMKELCVLLRVLCLKMGVFVDSVVVVVRQLSVEVPFMYGGL